jgi:hypothetical protein
MGIALPYLYVRVDDVRTSQEAHNSTACNEGKLTFFNCYTLWGIRLLLPVANKRSYNKLTIQLLRNYVLYATRFDYFFIIFRRKTYDREINIVYEEWCLLGYYAVWLL